MTFFGIIQLGMECGGYETSTLKQGMSGDLKEFINFYRTVSKATISIVNK